MRWATVVAVAAAATLARSVLGVSLQPGVLEGVVLAAVATNLAAEQLSRSSVPAWLYGSLLVFDTVLLTVALAATGGPANPFSAMYFIYVVLAAVGLGRVLTWAIVALTVAGYGSLFALTAGGSGDAATHAHHAMHGSGAAGFSLHLWGMWGAYTVAAVLVAFFVENLNAAARARSHEVARLREAVAETERLAALTTLAAGTAHELATPLATIAVIVAELEDQLKAGEAVDDLDGDLALIRQQIERCRAIIDRMRAVDPRRASERGARLSAAELRAVLVADVPDAEDRVRVELSGAPLWISAPLQWSLAALVSNGLRASAAGVPVTVRASRIGDRLHFEVIDHGRGMTPEILRRATEPFFTTRSAGQGMGLGLYLVRTFAEAAGGRFELVSIPGEGTTAVLEIPEPQSNDVTGA